MCVLIGPHPYPRYDRRADGRHYHLLNSENVNMVDVDVHMTKNLADMRIVIEVKDIAQLSRILARIENVPTCWKPNE